MATYDLTEGSACIAYDGLNRLYRLQIDVDCATDNIGSSETAALFNIPAYHKVLYGVVKVTTAEGGTATADIGITGGTVDGIIDGVNLNATGVTDTVSSGSTFGEQAIGTSAYTIDLLANNALDACAFTVTILVMDCS